MEFAHRTVLITGAAGNLGRAVAAAFTARGANLVLIDLKRESLERTFGAEAERRPLEPADLLDPQQVDAVVARAIKRFARIDVLCNLAGGFRMGPAVHETSDADWNHLFNLNVRTLLEMARSVIPRMLAAGGGKIVDVGASSALRARRRWPLTRPRRAW